jgi:A/G-specific adenine glycosylase
MNLSETLSSTKLNIHGWYEKNLRDLPMRHTRDPYRTWVAEVILQQTRMDQGLPYFKNFLDAYPDVETLASASENEVLRLWQGLGYYSRARNMLASARYIVEHFNGQMPGSYRELLKLKGVGKYTAAAIASWCYGEPVAAVDGNVARVLARLFGIFEAINTPAGEKKIQKLATELLDRTDPGRHNQAMIDFGAMMCLPRLPACNLCPLAELCEAKRRDCVDRIPVKQKNKKPSERWFYYYMIRSDRELILVQRGKKDIWEGLYEPPMIESAGPRSEEEIVQQMLPTVLQESEASYGKGYKLIGELSDTLRHQLSHQTIHARFLQVELDPLPHPLPERWRTVPLEELDRYAMPRLIHRYLEQANFSYL